MRRLTAFMLALVFAWPTRAVAHPIHTTVLQLRWDSATGMIEGTLRIFADDLEYAAQSARVTSSVYLLSRLGLWSRDQRIALQLCGEKRLGDAVLVCVRGRASHLGAVRIRNAVLLERYADQVNIVRLDAARSSTVLLTGGSPERAISVSLR